MWGMLISFLLTFSLPIYAMISGIPDPSMFEGVVMGTMFLGGVAFGLCFAVVIMKKVWRDSWE